MSRDWPTIEELAAVQPMSKEVREGMFELFIKPELDKDEDVCET